MNDCPLCEHKDIEIERLKLEIERLKNKFQHIKLVIEDGLKFLRAMIKWASDILDNESGIPRGKWSFAKGAYKVAEQIIARLEYIYREVLKC